MTVYMKQIDEAREASNVALENYRRDQCYETKCRLYWARETVEELLHQWWKQGCVDPVIRANEIPTHVINLIEGQNEQVRRLTREIARLELLTASLNAKISETRYKLNKIIDETL